MKSYAGPLPKKSDTCWKNYEMAGTKKIKGKTVPNCIPKKKK